MVCETTRKIANTGIESVAVCTKFLRWVRLRKTYLHIRPFSGFVMPINMINDTNAIRQPSWKIIDESFRESQ